MFLQLIKSAWLTWVGHTECMGEKKNSCRAYVVKPGNRCEYNIKMVLNK
jgi:hypothetical protein